uniref:Uncharacterized protein n=1 Tax=Parascaris equorum TaxID=6256 RepID=A0A914RN77_PAREQ
MLSICDTPRVHSSALSELKQSIVKLWRHADKLKESSWIKSAVGECDIEALKRNFDTLLNAISTDQKWSTLVGKSLLDVAFMLITDKGKVDLKITNGRFFVAASFIIFTNGHLDVIVSIVLEHTAQVLNSWKSLQKLTDVVCCLKEETGIALVRALLPVIVQREQLVAAIVTEMRRHALQTMGINTTVGNNNAAIEVISILRRALSQPASTRSLLYKYGSSNICPLS